MATRLLDPLGILGIRLDWAGRRGRRLVRAAFESLDPHAIGQDVATTLVTYDPDDEESELGRSLVDVLVEHFMDAQIDALDAAAEYLGRVSGDASKMLAPVDGFLGQMGNTSVRSYVSKTPQGIVARISGGMPPEDALSEAADYLSKIADAEPHIMGRDAVATAANNDDRFAGYARVARPDACDWCKMLASRGAVYTAKTATLTRDGQPYHQRRANGSGGTCRCRMVAVPAGGGQVPTTYRPPRAGQTAATGSRYHAGARTPERARTVERQLAVLRQTKAAGRATDWTHTRIAELEVEQQSLLGILTEAALADARDVTVGLYASKGLVLTGSLRHLTERHLPGKHDQKKHAGGKGGMPAGEGQAADVQDLLSGPATQGPTAASAHKRRVMVDVAERMSDVPATEMLDCLEAVNNGAPGYSDGSDGNGILMATDAIRHAAGTPDEPYVHLARDSAGYFYSTYKGESPVEGWQYARPGTAEYDTMVREGVAASLVNTWAQTSNDHHEGALAIQNAIRAEFGLVDAAGWPHASGERIYQQHSGTLRKFAAAMYENTQADLAANGITEVTVYRGTGNTTFEPTAGALTTTLRPASSWSADHNVAVGFAMHATERSGEAAAVMTLTVPADQVLSTPRTGVGCLHEREVVLLGGVMAVKASLVDPVVPTSAPPATWPGKGEPITWQEALTPQP